MDPLEQANRFVNCVMNRYRSDTVMRTGGTLLMIVAPLLAMAMALVLANKNKASSDISQYIIWVSLLLFFYVLSLVMFMIYRRLVDHSVRDREWRLSLIGYVHSKGFDTSGMEKIDKKIRRSESSVAEVPAILVIIAYFVLIMTIIFDPHKYNLATSGGEGSYITLIIFGGLLSFVMMLFVFLYVLKFPYMHESKQIDFTIEMCRIVENTDVHLITMRQTVNHKSVILSIFLFLITLGLYTLVMVHRTYVDANNHIQNQWSYESRLVELIVANEHGVGVAPGAYEVKL